MLRWACACARQGERANLSLIRFPATLRRLGCWPGIQTVLRARVFTLSRASLSVPLTRRVHVRGWCAQACSSALEAGSAGVHTLGGAACSFCEHKVRAYAAVGVHLVVCLHVCLRQWQRSLVGD